jgi:penicillin-binding protein 2
MWWWRLFKKSRRRKNLDPDEIFLDSKNISSFNVQQFEGRIETPISKKVLRLLLLSFILVNLAFLWRLVHIQIFDGELYAKQSEDNKLKHTLVFAERGIMYDRNGKELAWNDNGRKYIDIAGFSHLLGYVGYPSEKQITEFDYNPKQLVGKAGVEESLNHSLLGKNGLRVEEVNAKGEAQSDHVLEEPQSGESVYLSVDADLQAGMYEAIKQIAQENGFRGGAGVVMDIKTGEMLVLTSYPEYNSNILSTGDDRETISKYNTNQSLVFLNRALSGRYPPGSTVKPFLAIAALAEKTVSSGKHFYTTGELVLPNPYNPDNPTIFPDNKNHGSVDMRKAIAVSSNVYFYIIGGGFKDQKGLGIYNIYKYAKMFGLGEKTGIDLAGEIEGIVPSPEWKEKNFSGEPWRIGDTYHTSIGQYGFSVTPLQEVRAFGALASNGNLMKPILERVATSSTLVKPQKTIDLPASYFKVIHEGMRMTVTEGTAQPLNLPGLKMAAKSGSAEIDDSKKFVNSWVSGFWPYDNPRYAFTVVMERGPRTTTVGAGRTMRRFIDIATPTSREYFYQ